MATENKTAVEWLWEQIPFEHTSSRAAFDVYQKAKEFEKQQMKKFVEHLFVIGDNSKAFFDKEFEQFYNQTYGGDNG